MDSSVVSGSGGESIQLSDSARASPPGAQLLGFFVVPCGRSVADLQEAMAIHAASNCTCYKNRLQEWAQQNNVQLPFYNSVTKGHPHQLKFKSIVWAGGEQFRSHQWHSSLEDAEHDAAKVAYEDLVIVDDDFTDVLELIDQNVVSCKAILYQFAVKTKATLPMYCVHGEGLPPRTLFVSSVSFAGNTYTGEAATNKKGAYQKAARLAVKSILATNNKYMKEIFRSKKRQIIAIERAASQENCNTPRNATTTVAPIKFVPVVGAACPTAAQGVNIIPAADTSARAMSGSKKRRSTGQDVIFLT